MSGGYTHEHASISSKHTALFVTILVTGLESFLIMPRALTNRRPTPRFLIRTKEVALAKPHGPATRQDQAPMHESEENMVLVHSRQKERKETKLSPPAYFLLASYRICDLPSMSHSTVGPRII